MINRLLAMVKPFALSIFAVAIIALTAGDARADLIQLTNTQLSGQGIGATLTVLTLQTNGQATTESAYVSYTGGTQQTFGDFSPPDSSPKNRVFTFGQLGITNASELALIVNLAEPNNEVPATVTATTTGSISSLANRLTLNVWSSTGQFIESHTLADDTTLIMDQSGVGGSGLVFALNPAQAAALQNLFANNPGIVLSVGATFASAQGGNDTIQATRLQAVPEPTTMLLLGTGLVGIAAKARRRRQRNLQR